MKTLVLFGIVALLGLTALFLLVKQNQNDPEPAREPVELTGFLIYIHHRHAADGIPSYSVTRDQVEQECPVLLAKFADAVENGAAEVNGEDEIEVWRFLREHYGHEERTRAEVELEGDFFALNPAS